VLDLGWAASGGLPKYGLIVSLPASPALGRIKLTAATYKIGYFVGSLACGSINRTPRALIKLAPEELEFAIPTKV
jgi:hypothetical protein